MTNHNLRPVVITLILTSCRGREVSYLFKRLHLSRQIWSNCSFPKQHHYLLCFYIFSIFLTLKPLWTCFKCKALCSSSFWSCAVYSRGDYPRLSLILWNCAHLCVPSPRQTPQKIERNNKVEKWICCSRGHECADFCCSSFKVSSNHQTFMWRWWRSGVKMLVSVWIHEQTATFITAPVMKSYMGRIIDAFIPSSISWCSCFINFFDMVETPSRTSQV